MSVLCNHYLPCVVGKKQWRMQILVEKWLIIAMVSDEAFVLFILENICNDMMELNIDIYC